MIRRSLNHPNGALAGLKSLSNEANDGTAMLTLLIDFWSAVKQVFSEAWGKPPSDSRLMHSVGIAAMGELMDRITARADTSNGLCAWTQGQWPDVGRSWDSFQQTPKDMKMLSQLLVQLYAQRSRQ
jgi:hypothetical protein